MTKRFHFVAEITLTVDDVGTQQTFYFSTAGFTTKPTDTPANTVVQEYLEDPGTLRRELFSGARVNGPVRPSFGQIVLTNHAGVLDDWISYGISGGRVVVRYGEEGAAYPAGFSTVYIAYAYSVVVDFDRVRVLLRDLLYKLEEPVVNDIFSGGGGLEGTGIAQRKKQMAFGRPGYFPPVLIDSQKQVYFVQSNAADERAFRGTNPPLYLVFEGGRGLNFGGYYTSETDLFNAAPPAAGFFKLFAPGVDELTPESSESAGPLYFRLGSPPEFELRFPSLGLLKEGPTQFARAWNFRDLLTRAGIAYQASPGTYLKNAGNILIDGDQSYLDVMTDACAPTFSAYGFDRLGRFFTLDLRDPTEGADPSVYTFDLTNSKDIRRQPVPGGEAPIWQVSVSVGRTWPTSSLRTSLTPEERDFFQRSPWQAAFTGTSFSVRAANPGAETATVEIQGNELTSTAAKFQYVRRFLYLFGSRRELVTLTTQLTAETMALELHQKVTLRMPRFGCDSGRLFRIVTLDLNCRARTVTVGLWGGPAGPDDAVLGGGSFTPGGGTGQTVTASGAGRLDDFVSIFYGRNIGGGGGGQSTLDEWGQFAYGRNTGFLPTWNSADATADIVLSNGDKTAVGSGTAAVRGIQGYPGSSAGSNDRYFEITVGSPTASSDLVGVAYGSSFLSSSSDWWDQHNYFILLRSNGQVFRRAGGSGIGSLSLLATVGGYVDGDILGFKLTASATQLTIYRNGSSLGMFNFSGTITSIKPYSVFEAGGPTSHTLATRAADIVHMPSGGISYE